MKKKDLHVDPVCKMVVTPEGAAVTYEYEGVTYYFCDEGCLEEFLKEPEKYASMSSAKYMAQKEKDKGTE